MPAKYWRNFAKLLIFRGLALAYANGGTSVCRNINLTISIAGLIKDAKGKARIIERIRSAERGNFGDCGTVGGGVSEMRIHFGPGYREYFTRSGKTIYVLLCGGTKRTQNRDVAKAKELAQLLKEV